MAERLGISDSERKYEKELMTNDQRSRINDY